MRCLLILAHPRRHSLCGALFDAYAAGARQAGAQCRELILSELRFDPDVHALSSEQQPLEPNLARAQSDMGWAEHLVFVYPTWWGTFPALLKGFLDRVLTPGFAFRHHLTRQTEPAAGGPTADLITTMDTPPLVYRLIYRSPGRQALAPATLGYCGVRTVRVEVFGPAIASSATQRNDWLARARASGARLVHGALSPSAACVARGYGVACRAAFAVLPDDLDCLHRWRARRQRRPTVGHGALPARLPDPVSARSSDGLPERLD